VHFSGARAGALLNHFCSVSKDNFCLSADGNVTACFEAFGEDNPCAGAFFYGRPAADGMGYVFDQAVLDHLRAQAVENREYCRGCFAKWSCGGDCYYKWIGCDRRRRVQTAPPLPRDPRTDQGPDPREDRRFWRPVLARAVHLPGLRQPPHEKC